MGKVMKNSSSCHFPLITLTSKSTDSTKVVFCAASQIDLKIID